VSSTGREPGGTAGPNFLGLRWLHRRFSRTIDGVGWDADHLAEDKAARLVEREVVAA